MVVVNNTYILGRYLYIFVLPPVAILVYTRTIRVGTYTNGNSTTYYTEFQTTEVLKK